MSSPLLRSDPYDQERRRHQRVRVAVLGRYMLANRQEFPCQTIDMSPGGVALVAPVRGALKERVICYIDQIGRIEGTVARMLESGFALSLNVPLVKREKLADQLTWLGNRHALGMPEDRRHERVAPRNPRSTLRLPDGRDYPIRLIDVSVSGAAFTADIHPPVGTPVTIGQTPAHVVRGFNGGVAVEFARPFSADSDASALQL
ncbi:PilZ domain-containing protein [Lichenibacterium minor]|uniref:PilZ domain-containing protein n=1 Tax=Lichenibacterium minor TaxID=2316528 RepID=A0A4Q2U558_9HYPH|nr:PilZ domain-containing protein [Lichenibacterium minor]RYC31430.1 PilZ domain-containing protein [Lichenibacterium minor]